MLTRVSVFSMVCSFVVFADEVNPILLRNQKSPNKAFDARFCERDSGWGVQIKTTTGVAHLPMIFIVKPLVWASDNSGVFAVEHAAGGNSLYFLSIPGNDGVIRKTPIDPNLDGLRASRVVGILLKARKAEIKFLITLSGQRIVDRYYVLYRVEFEYSSHEIHPLEIDGLPRSKVDSFLKEYKVIRVSSSLIH